MVNALILLRRTRSGPLSSALRLYMAEYFHNSAPRYGLVDPESRLAVRIERPSRSRKKPKQEAAAALERVHEQLMASRYFVAGKVRAGWFDGRELSPVGASIGGNDAQVWGDARRCQAYNSQAIA
jgi:hypothetical protein